ncbi:MAG TPA: FtsX-like permease family protein [Bdellovibrio sp.]|nr:FtsX-like permease family protein [Bdellovibrio sp.]
MKDLLSWKLALRNLLRNKRRSLATGLAIWAGCIGVMLLMSYLMSSFYKLRTMAVYVGQRGQVAILKNKSLDNFNSKPKKYMLSPEEVGQIEKLIQQKSEFIEFTGKYLTGSGLISVGSNNFPFLALGFEPETYDKIYKHPEVQKWAEDFVLKSQQDKSDYFLHNPHAVSPTKKIRELMGSSQDLQLMAKNIFNQLNATEAEIGPDHTTGLVFLEETSLQMPLSILQDLYSTDGIQYFSIYLKDYGQTTQLKNWLEQQIQSHHWPFEVYAFYDSPWSAFYVGTIGFFRILIGFFVVLVCGAVCLSVISTTTMGLVERLHEVGTLRAMGFTSWKITTLFTQEVFLLSIISLILGVISAGLLCLLINSFHWTTNPPGAPGPVPFILILNFDVYVFTFLGMVLLTSSSAAVVIYIKQKSKIVDLLGDSGA